MHELFLQSIFVCHLQAFVSTGYPPVDRALLGVDGRRCQHRWLGLEHLVVDKAELD